MDLELMFEQKMQERPKSHNKLSLIQVIRIYRGLSQNHRTLYKFEILILKSLQGIAIKLAF